MGRSKTTGKEPRQEPANPGARVAGPEVGSGEHNLAEETLLLAQFTVDHAAMAVFWIGPEARVFRVNDVACRSLGYSREELLDKAVYEFDPDFPQERWPDHWKDLKQRGSMSFESHHRTKDGRIFPVEVSANYLEFKGREYNVAFARDITERKRAEKLVEAANERLNYLLGSTSVAIYTAKTSGDYEATSVTESVTQLTGYEPREFLENSSFWIDHVHPEDSERILDEVARLFERGSHSYEYRFLHKDGTYRWMRDEMKLTKDDLGNPQEIVGYWVDITDRKRAEEALRERESLLTDVFASIQDGISILDTQLNIVRVNRTMEQWYAHTMPVTGKKCYEAYHERSAPCEICPTRHTLETGQTSCEVIPKRGPGGKIVGWLDLYSFPFVDTATGQLKGVIEYVRDVTERKQAEEALQTADRLAAMGTMVAGVAHEVNTPLTTICGLAELLSKDRSLTAQARESAEGIVQQAIRCGKIVEDLLGFARAGRVCFESVQVNALIKRCLDFCRASHRFDDIEIVEEYEAKLPETMADPYRLEQVFINIIRNAGDILKETGPVKRLTVQSKRSGKEIRVEFTDTGLGMADPNKVFDPFYTTKITGEGTGLGLSVSLGIVRDHGGTLTAENTAEGARFVVTLPVRRSPRGKGRRSKRLENPNTGGA
ncbi:MAG: PAS domain-containing sensor histidine kinase [Planctomycetota bacterium]